MDILPFMQSTLTTSSDVIDALGGTAAVTRLTKRKSMRVVSNWRKGTLPQNTYLVLTSELARIGKAAPPSVWGMAEPDAEKAA